MKPKILIVEDQFIEANNLRLILNRAGFFVLPIASSVVEAIDIIDRDKPDLVLLDIYLDGVLTGIDLAKILNARNIAFVYISANSNRKTFLAAKATKPYGFLVKPFRQKDVLAALEVALYIHFEKQNNKQAPQHLAKDETSGYKHVFNRIVSESKAMQNVFESIQLVGASESSVLILGESGTGKELVANCIHEISNRKSQPLVVVNCGALPPNLVESELFGHEKGAFTGAYEQRVGKFEQAEGGTIFLDEVGELTADLQVKFLRVLQEKEISPIGGKTKKINVRIIAATNRNLEDEVASGKFRADLYYRLNVFPISLPPLRERREDILLLANFFIQKFSKIERKTITGFSENVIDELLKYEWPGNIRELENVMRRTVLLCTGNTVDKFYHQTATVKKLILNDPGKMKTIFENEKDHILSALKHCNWKVYGPGGAAELLEIHVSTLNSKIKKLGIEKIRQSTKNR